MALNTFVIINNITNLSDARYCAGMGADVLGFTLEPDQPSSISESTFKELTGWVAGVLFLAEFTTTSVQEINKLAAEHQLDFVLLNQNYTASDAKQIEKPVIIKLTFDNEKSADRLKALMEDYNGKAEYFLIDSENTEEISADYVSLLRDLCAKFPVIIGFGLNATNLLAILQQAEPAGVCLKGGHEIKPGLRNFDDLADMLELLQPEED